MVNIFYLVFGLSSGGKEKYSLNLYEHINKDKYNLQFIVKYMSHDFFDDQYEAAGGHKIALMKVNTKLPEKINTLIFAFRVFKSVKENYDIAYFNLNKPADVFTYPLICRLAGQKKIIIHSHSSSQDDETRFLKVMNALGRFVINSIASAKFACSDKAAVWMFGEKHAKKRDYKLITNGLEINDYDFNENVRSRIRLALGIKPDQMVVGHVGRFATTKNHTFILDVFKEIVKIQPNAILILIGVGPLEKDITKKAESLKIISNVKFMGEVVNVNEYLQAMDVFLLPSIFEGLPISGVEAQASGLHCVYSNNISREADITGNVQFLGLDEGTKKWASTVIAESKICRQSEKKKVAKAGFDIAYSTRQVESTINRLMK
ncbi:glycosyltransferase [Lactiplantibacillus pingfangensis]|uniref:glycosyltransferase n=1 Tax=Lactiplantibacillus pingfangensis TaxID=2559915 RepID=UPI0010F61146|nr:glycosyltransferase [Lactiplantibacillus pingfangensis]